MSRETTTPAPATEQQMIALLRRKIAVKSGNGPQGCVITQVKDAAGFDARRSLDAVSMKFWASHGLLLEGYECKSSRSDLLRELKDPSKAEQFSGALDRFWIIAGGPGIAKPEELPAAWGLMVVKGGKLVTVKAATQLHDLPGDRPADQPLPPGFSRGILVSLLRNSTAQQEPTPQEITAAASEARKALSEQHARQLERLEASRDALQSQVDAFRTETGIDITGKAGWPQLQSNDVARAVRLVLSGEHDTARLEQRLQRLVEQAQNIADAGRRVAGTDHG